MTRALILAAGTGSRLLPLTADRPKALVPLLGQALLLRQLQVLRTAGWRDTDIALVTGYRAEAFDALGLRQFSNPSYETTNMVASLSCARAWLDGSDDVLVAYGDIVYEPAVLQAVMCTPGPLAVAVDRGWHTLWSMRSEDPLADAETLRVDTEGHILELGGKPSSLAEIEGQYIGLFRIDRSLAPRFLAPFDGAASATPSQRQQRDRMFMTELLQHHIDQGLRARAAEIRHGWLEVDTVEDLRRYEAAQARGALAALYRAAPAA